MRFRTVLALHMSVLVAVVLGAAFGAVAIVLGRAALRQAGAELARARSVLDEDAARRRSLDEAQAAVMGEEPRLKAVVVTEDVNPETVLDVAAELRRELRADRFIVVDGDGKAVADVGQSAGADLANDPLVVRAVADGSASGIWVADGRAWEMHARRLAFGQSVVGVLILGYAVDDRLMAGFARQTATHAVVLAGGRRVAGTLDAGDLERVGAEPVEVDVGGAAYLARSTAFPGSTELRVVLLRPLEEARAARRALLGVVAVIAAAALAVVLAVAGMVTRRLSRPLERLVAFTDRIAEGDLEARVDPGRAVAEVRTLAEAMNLMAARLDESRGRLILADRMASVGTLAAGVAHEINNPLTWVMGNLEYLAAELPELVAKLGAERRAELEEVLGQTREGADRVRKIVRDLKLFSRADEGERGPVDIHKVLDLAVNMTRAELRHRARLVRDYGTVPPVLASESRLGQVFVNLLVNAAQAIVEGKAEDNEVRLTTRCDGAGGVVVEVRDSGAGIPAAIRERIFDPFFTTKAVGVGTGLGLAICHGIVADLGGRIEVESSPAGSCFRVVLPVAAQAAEERAPAPEARPAPARGRVLVVDDEPMVAAMLVRELAGEHDVEVASSGREALERLGNDYDVILCDLMMPEVTGMELFAELRRSAPHLAPRMVFVTGGAFTTGGREFLAEVPNPRFEKPVDLASLRALISERVLARGRI
jgi:signal transduction histidine kinase/CheY-like chemotaxis protein